MSVGFKQFPNKAARQDHLLKESIEEGGGVDLSEIEGRLDVVEGKVSTLEGQDNPSEIARLEGLISTLTTRVEGLEDSGDNPEP